MKKLITVVALLAFTICYAGDVSVVDFGVTNAIVASGTESTNVGSPVAVDKQDDGNVGLIARVQGSSAGTGNVTVTLARSPDGGTTVETTPKFTWIFPMNGTTAVIAYTNLATGLLGAADSIQVISVQNADDTILTNCYFKVIKKKVH